MKDKKNVVGYIRVGNEEQIGAYNMNIESIKKMVDEAVPSLENANELRYLLTIIEQADKALKRLQSKAYVVGNTVMLHELNVEIEALQAIRK